MFTLAGYFSRLWLPVLVPIADHLLCHSCDTGVLLARQRPSSHLTAASWVATMVEQHSYCTSTARGQQLCYRSREGGRESALLSSLQPGQEKSQLLSYHPGGVVLHAKSPMSLLNVSSGETQWRFTSELVALSSQYNLAWCHSLLCIINE